ncbi:hypothetical protein NKG94_34635 [Micromonospora sp. M12]
MAYCEARDSGRTRQAALLAVTVADDVEQWRNEVDRLDALCVELVGAINRLTGGAS